MPPSLGDPTSVHWNRKFDLVVMTGHAFQVFLEDEDLRASLASVRSALKDHGRFAFETRNPLAREWERWLYQWPQEIEHDGVRVRMSGTRPEMRDDRLSFSNVYTSPRWRAPLVSQSTLRFLDRARLESFLTEAGFAIEVQFGDFDRSPPSDASPEIITMARLA